MVYFRYTNYLMCCIYMVYFRFTNYLMCCIYMVYFRYTNYLMCCIYVVYFRYTNYLMCYICAPFQNRFYGQEKLTVCEEFCNAWYSACSTAILKGNHSNRHVLVLLSMNVAFRIHVHDLCSYYPSTCSVRHIGA